MDKERKLEMRKHVVVLVLSLNVQYVCVCLVGLYF